MPHVAICSRSGGFRSDRLLFAPRDKLLCRGILGSRAGSSARQPGERVRTERPQAPECLSRQNVISRLTHSNPGVAAHWRSDDRAESHLPDRSGRTATLRAGLQRPDGQLHHRLLNRRGFAIGPISGMRGYSDCHAQKREAELPVLLCFGFWFFTSPPSVVSTFMADCPTSVSSGVSPLLRTVRL